MADRQKHKSYTHFRTTPVYPCGKTRTKRALCPSKKNNLLSSGMSSQLLNQPVTKTQNAHHLLSVLNSDIIFACLMALLLLKCAALRLSMPAPPFIDGDVRGYLKPALRLLNGEPLKPGSARGIYYPLFTWINMYTTGSVNAIAITQHVLGIIGLLLSALAFNSLLGHEHGLLKKGLILAGIAVLGLDNDIILWEHIIRPEGLLMFMAGCIFYLLQKFYGRPTSRVFVWLQLTLALSLMLMPKFALGCLFLGVYALYRYWGRANRRVIMYTLLAITLIISWQSYLNRKDQQAKYFLAKNFFYINAPTIQASQNFDKNFSANEQEAIKMAADSSLPNSSFPLLGFNPDGAQYGPTAVIIEERFGTNIYKEVMYNSLLHCIPGLFAKAFKQASAYYSAGKNISIVAQTGRIDYKDHLEKSLLLTPFIAFPNLGICQNYISSLKSFIVKYKNTSPEKVPLYFRMYAFINLLVPYILLFTAFYACYRAVMRNNTFMLLLLALHFLLLLPLTIVQTFDIARYCCSLFPFLIFIFISGLYNLLSVAINLYKKFEPNWAV